MDQLYYIDIQEYMTLQKWMLKGTSHLLIMLRIQLSSKVDRDSDPPDSSNLQLSVCFACAGACRQGVRVSVHFNIRETDHSEPSQQLESRVHEHTFRCTLNHVYKYVMQDSFLRWPPTACWTFAAADNPCDVRLRQSVCIHYFDRSFRSGDGG